MAKSAKDSMAKLRDERKAQGLKNYNLWLNPGLLASVAKEGETVAETISRVLASANNAGAKEGESEQEAVTSDISSEDAISNYLQEVREQLQQLAGRVLALESKAALTSDLTSEQVVISSEVSSEVTSEQAPSAADVDDAPAPKPRATPKAGKQISLADFTPEKARLLEALAAKQNGLDAATRRSALLEAVALAASGTGGNLTAVGNLFDAIGITPLKGGDWKTAGKVSSFYNPNKDEVQDNFPHLQSLNCN
jgi:hypothetical protein